MTKKTVLLFVCMSALSLIAATIIVQGPRAMPMNPASGGSTNSAIRQFQAGEEYINVTLTNQYQTAGAFQN